MHELSIIILQHNSPNEVTNCLRSLQKSWLPEKTEIIIIDNGGQQANEKIPKDSYKPLEEKNINIRFLDIPNKGYPNGNNAGLKVADGKFIAVVNPDITTEHDTIKLLLNYLETHKKVGIVAPRLIYPSGQVQDNYRKFPRLIDLIIKRTPFLLKLFPQRMRRYLMWDKNPTLDEPVDWVTGAFEIVRREVFDTIGFHDEKYFLFMSDIAICRDAWAKGFEVHFVGSAKAHHGEKRLSSGGFRDIFKKKVLRIHIMDAIKYYFAYFLKPIPPESPSGKDHR